jgi:hypothetical protein
LIKVESTTLTVSVFSFIGYLSAHSLAAATGILSIMRCNFLGLAHDAKKQIINMYLIILKE